MRVWRGTRRRNRYYPVAGSSIIKPNNHLAVVLRDRLESSRLRTLIHAARAYPGHVLVTFKVQNNRQLACPVPSVHNRLGPVEHSVKAVHVLLYKGIAHVVAELGLVRVRTHLAHTAVRTVGLGGQGTAQGKAERAVVRDVRVVDALASLAELPGRAGT